jgi:hypothetical protein
MQALNNPDGSHRLYAISGATSADLAAVPSLQSALMRAGVDLSTPETLLATLPFAANDTTCGTETELQAAVAGRREDVDLAVTIEQSNFFANILKRAEAGETPRSLIADLERFLNANPDRTWENSLVRFPRRLLSPYAARVLDRDLRADKGKPRQGKRGDAHRFLFQGPDGEELVRIPISYLLKLALADFLGSRQHLPESLRQTGERLMGHFLNDNTSPETFSFHITRLRPEAGMGRAIAGETAKRYLFTQLLVMYANDKFGLKERGQEAMVYFAPHPPVRQQELNGLITDAFYRELFMSPCLSGWDRGEEKFRYMQLCHQVLSRSQLNAVAKLREAGIITTNLVVLPNLSNVSLANNGTHISIGSRRLSRAHADPTSGFSAVDEKSLGDQTTKIVEHFLPLFVGTYSGAPYRLAFTDFHPERALGFLPHELDYTHLRMIWRRWRKKADLSVFGRPLTPFGPEWLDRLASGLFRLRGDFVPDYRLISYFVSLLSTDRSPALDGTMGNGDRLKQDLADMGVFDSQMSLYLLFKQREFARMGFSGFEGRFYSQFENLEDDLGGAADLQTLITALAFKYIATGAVRNEDIPDTPSVESERRQAFFGGAIDIPTFFVRDDSGNRFLRKILHRTREIRPSRRYPGYQRVYRREYCRALVQLIFEDGADLIEAMNLHETMNDLMTRLEHPDRHSASGRLTRAILESVNARSPLDVDAREFNLAAESYYRGALRKAHMMEGFRFLEEDLLRLETGPAAGDMERAELHAVCGEQGAAPFMRKAREDILGGRASAEVLGKTISLMLVTITNDIRTAGQCGEK